MRIKKSRNPLCLLGLRLLICQRWDNDIEYGFFYSDSKLVAITYEKETPVISDGLYSDMKDKFGEADKIAKDNDGTLAGCRWYGLDIDGTTLDYVCFNNVYDNKGHVVQMYVLSDYSQYRIYSAELH